MNVILASQSPRRRELLSRFPFPFTVKVADIDEYMDPGQAPEKAVAQVSRRKAEAIERSPEDVVIAADTIVVCCGYVLGKPCDEEDAFQMLSMLSGRVHQVMTGITVLYGDKSHTHTEITEVAFRNLTEKEIHCYIASGEPMDKAGAYGIQGLGCLLVEGICGDYYNVMGLPVLRLSRMLEHFGVKLL